MSFRASDYWPSNRGLSNSLALLFPPFIFNVSMAKPSTRKEETQATCPSKLHRATHLFFSLCLSNFLSLSIPQLYFPWIMDSFKPESPPPFFHILLLNYTLGGHWIIVTYVLSVHSNVCISDSSSLFITILLLLLLLAVFPIPPLPFRLIFRLFSEGW